MYMPSGFIKASPNMTNGVIVSAKAIADTLMLLAEELQSGISHDNIDLVTQRIRAYVNATKYHKTFLDEVTLQVVKLTEKARDIAAG